jgi:hypothetical protein
MEKVNFGTDPYLSRLLDILITYDARWMPRHWEFGWPVDGEVQLLLHLELDSLSIGSLGSRWMEKND